MLGENIIPSGIGHSTNYILRVKGSDTGNAYLVTDNLLPKQHNVEVSWFKCYYVYDYFMFKLLNYQFFFSLFLIWLTY